MEPETTTSNDAELEKALSTLLEDLPVPVQNFVLGPERARVALELSAKYGLHVDQAGEFERAYMLMLLGAASPQEFVSTLTAAGIAPETVTKLTTDVNDRVFIPLREAERSAPKESTSAPVVQATPIKREPVVPLFAPVPEPTPRPVAAAPVTLPGSTEPVPQQFVPQMPPAPYMTQMPMMNPAMYPMPPYGNPYAASMYGWPMQMPPMQQMAWPGMPAQYPPQPVAQSTPVVAPTPTAKIEAPVVHYEAPAVPVSPPPVAPASWTPPNFLLSSQPTQTPPRSHGSDPYREPVL